MRVGMCKMPFLHLVHERYPSFRTPCLSHLYKEVFGKELKGLLSSYCCSHFVVGRERITARPLKKFVFYQKLMGIVEESRYAKARDP